jgi:hypothetical protein
MPHSGHKTAAHPSSRRCRRRILPHYPRRMTANHRRSQHRIHAADAANWCRLFVMHHGMMGAAGLMLLMLLGGSEHHVGGWLLLLLLPLLLFKEVLDEQRLLLHSTAQEWMNK